MDITKIPDLINQISTALQPLTEKLGVGGKYLYELTVRECLVEGVENLIFLILCISINIYIFKNFHKWDPPGHYDAPVRKILGGIFAICFFLIFVFADSAIKDLLNPQYQAIQSVLCSLKGC